MKVRRDSWHGRMYFWWLNLSLKRRRTWSGEDLGSGYSIRPKKTENFCHYFRVVFLYAPVSWLFVGSFHIGARRIYTGALLLATAAVSLLTIGLIYDTRNTLIFIGIMTGGALVFLFIVWIAYLKDQGKISLEVAEDNPLRMISQRIAAKKRDTICPLIEFDEPKEIA